MPRTSPDGPTLDDLLEQVVFADHDPRVQNLKGVWEESKRTAWELLAAGDRENFEARLAYVLD